MGRYRDLPRSARLQDKGDAVLGRRSSDLGRLPLVGRFKRLAQGPSPRIMRGSPASGPLCIQLSVQRRVFERAALRSDEDGSGQCVGTSRLTIVSYDMQQATTQHSVMQFVRRIELHGMDDPEILRLAILLLPSRRAVAIVAYRAESAAMVPAPRIAAADHVRAAISGAVQSLQFARSRRTILTVACTGNHNQTTVTYL